MTNCCVLTFVCVRVCVRLALARRLRLEPGGWCVCVCVCVCGCACVCACVCLGCALLGCSPSSGQWPARVIHFGFVGLPLVGTVSDWGPSGSPLALKTSSGVCATPAHGIAREQAAGAEMLAVVLVCVCVCAPFRLARSPVRRSPVLRPALCCSPAGSLPPPPLSAHLTGVTPLKPMDRRAGSRSVCAALVRQARKSLHLKMQTNERNSLNASSAEPSRRIKA